MHTYKNYILTLLGCFVFVNLSAQNYNITNERTFSILFNKYIDTLENSHTSIRPFSKNELTKYDTLINSYATPKGDFIRNKHIVISKNKTFALDPIVNLGYTLEQGTNGSQNVIESSLGFGMQKSFGKKWSSQFAVLADYSRYPTHIDEQITTKNISPGYGYSKNNRSYYGQANITFTPDEIFAIQLGYGKNFIGDGYRSLLLSDNTNSYPYLKVTANIWKLKYMALYTNYQDIRNSDGKLKNYSNKLSTIHYLSVNATKWWNIGMFESIMWQAQEGNFYRGYDINYFNPVIMLRPVEYAQGSSDNALLGGSMKFKLRKKNILYAQLILDEFLLGELKSGNGWWANKYGYQFGLKSYDFATIKNLTIQLEYNMVRPFTYSHTYNPTAISTLQNYAHFNAPLAHPLGANFNEKMASISYQKNRWIIEAMTTVAKIGFDTSSTSTVGQNIYMPNNNRAAEYGHKTTQGLTTDIVNTTLKVSYLLNPKSQLLLQVRITNRGYKNSLEKTSNNLFFIGIKTAIGNRYSDF